MTDSTRLRAGQPADGRWPSADQHAGLRYPARDAPYYLPVADEIAVFETCHTRRLAVMLKGPTGCGKTRFVEHMAWRLGRPLVTVACHDDLSASDLTGRYLIRGGETVWLDGPLTLAARLGAICYLDEIIEARTDTVVVIHPLTDDRRILPLDKAGELLEADPHFQLVVSVQPRLPARAQGSEAEHAAAVCGARVCVSAGGTGIGHRLARGQRGFAHGDDARHAHETVAAAWRPGTCRGTQHAAHYRRGPTDRQRHSDADGVRNRAARTVDRRSGSVGGHA